MAIPLDSHSLSTMQLKHDAQLTLEILSDSSLAQDPFTEVFLRDRRDLQARFDIVIRYVPTCYLCTLSECVSTQGRPILR